MSGQLVSEFELLWNSGSEPPEVFEFIESRSIHAAGEILDILLRDQKHRWQTDDPISVEDYLSRLSLLASDPNAKLQLAVGEYESRVRGDRDVDVDVDEFASRFSDISDSLGAKLRVVEFETVTSESSTGEKFIGRYRLVRLLGSGAHGLVWLAFDTELHRKVAIKVPRAERFETPEDAEAYLAEARTVASLDQSNIVPVHDVGRNEDGSVYVVSKFIEGGTLADLIKHEPPDHEASSQLIATIATALNHAHEKRLIHRDIKPANLLIEQSTGTPYVSDFGLAIREEDYLKSSGIVGTPAYMSPEQTRGEGHRLDARSDIFSLGVVFYEMLTRKRPFRGASIHELRHQIISGEPRKPSDSDDSIPAELERICLKALAKRASDRYGTAAQFAEDLLNWRVGADSPQVQTTIVPRGLRSFDADDADYFLGLLPGPRDRSGLPESIYFWKKRMEETDPDKTFEVGLIYGPSGCGKSSLVKAGLMPRLSSDVISVYVEATPDDTERRILRGLRKHLPDLSEDAGLVETFSTLRRARGPKIVVIVDQFEQWLHAHRSEAQSELTDAFRQCDGSALQATVMVRDDFWLAASRFMSDVEVNLVQGHNIALVDLFDVEHAENVLIKFGQSFSKLPANASELSDQESEFVNKVAEGLARDGKVVSVRLALFAEMVKGKPWISETLQAVGGTEGIGVNFLEEAFSSDTANPMHRMHEAAARSVLQELLPEVGTDIKGQMRSHAELIQASGYEDRTRDFKELIRTLDGELRLITPTEHEGVRSNPGTEPESKYYQLTHDYLVPSLRDWLTRKQAETIKGRAELKLAERSSLWNAKSENRHLASFAEWIRIRWFTDKNKWSSAQQAMMQKSARVHFTRLGILALVLGVMTIVGLRVRDRVVEASNDEWATGLVTALVNANIEQVPGIIEDMQDYRTWADPKLHAQLDRYPEDADERLNLSLALLPADSSQRDYLLQRLLAAEPRQVTTIRSLLAGERDEIVDQLWAVLNQPTGPSNQCLSAAGALAVYDPANQAQWAAVRDRVVDSLVSENSLRAAIWSTTLEPVSDQLTEPLCQVFLNKNETRSQSEIDLATDVLESYAAEDVQTLGELILEADANQFLTLFDEFASHGESALSLLESELRQKLEFSWNDPRPEPDWSTPTAGLRLKLTRADGEIGRRYAFCQTLPIDEFESIADGLRACGFRPLRLRPYHHNEQVYVAAAFTRDGRDWRLAINRSAEDIQKDCMDQRKEKYVVVDLAGYVRDADGMPGEVYSAVWVKQRDDVEDNRVFIGVTANQRQAKGDAFITDGFKYQTSLQCFRGANDIQRYCGVYGRSDLHGQTGGVSTPRWDQTHRQVAENGFIDGIPWEMDISEVADDKATDATSANRYAVVWNLTDSYESKALFGLSISEHRKGCRQMEANGFRIASISVASVDGKRIATSVWHRPLVSETDMNRLARRQANATVAQFRMGRTADLWQRLANDKDPQLRTLLIHRLSPMGAAAKLLEERLKQETNASIRRALILALGQYDETNSGDRDTLAAKILTWYQEEPDPGIHGSAEWLLRRWGKQEDLNSVASDLAQHAAEGTDGWYVCQTNQHTMTVIAGPGAFTIGSPVSERHRFNRESSHERTINHSFAIATKEVTVKQFREFLKDAPDVKFSFTARYAPQDDCPQTNLSWYQAAMYCRWLSEKEGIDEDQMCYPPTAQIKAGMSIPADFLTRTGYRLPTEPEWECACRARTTTSRYFGRSDDLVKEYAWYSANSSDHTWPVAILKPNDYGLFDMHGNVWEWCHDLYSDDPSKSLPKTTDKPEVLDDTLNRAMRGGSFDNQASVSRSAYRRGFRPASFYTLGFRPCRTYRADE